MATRDKKLSVGRKQSTSSPLPPKEPVTSGDVNNKTSTDSEPNEEPLSSNLVKNPAAKVAAAATTAGTPVKSPTVPLVRKLANKAAPKKLTKKPTIAIKLKPKIKKPIKPKIVKALMNNPKNAEAKKLLKNCPRTVKPKKAKVAPKIDDESLPPVLEPIFPIDDNIDSKQTKKKPTKAPKIDNYAKKIKPETGSETVEDTPLENLTIDQSKTKRVYKRKAPKLEPSQTESIEDVMNDLSSVIKNSEIKEESDDVPSESSKCDTPLKPKRVVKRKKKENIENTLSKLSPSQRKIIDMLDLNVQKFKKGIPATKRRHSIEKFPVGTLDADVSSINQLSIFNTVPRSLSPRSKTTPKTRQSMESLNRRSHPYKTRSDSPARILRNGKHRKLKDLSLLEGLDITKRRRRNYSDFSGSELSISKFSGYESDSSFSDMSSLHGAENSESKDIDIKGESKENIDLPDEFSPDAIKRSPSTNGFDTNSNLCYDSKEEAPQVKTEDVPSDTTVNPSIKVPEKSLILDIMKQTFNDTFDDKEEKEKRSPKPKTSKLKPTTVSPLSFYGNKEIKNEDKEVEEKIPETVEPENPTELLPTHETAVEDGANIEEEAPLSKLSENGVVSVNNELDETPEDLAIKETILQALGLQSLTAAKEAKLKSQEKSDLRGENYTGTLKTVIKINRVEKRRGKNSMKMTLHKNKGKTNNNPNDCDPAAAASAAANVDDHLKPLKDGPSTSWKHGGQWSDTAGAHRKSHYSNRSNMDGSSEHTSDGETAGQEGSTKALVIPEKASSFSIHPGRICKDECSYCFGKFGLFDTPCHIAQMKSVDRQNKILMAEKHLTRDSCLCDACYRHVDRKANTPSYTNKSYKRSVMVAPGPRQDHCHVLGCQKVASNILRRKWIIKMRKSICEVINIDLDNPGLHSIPICDEHYAALEHLMVCAMCKRRLAKNHVHYLGPETNDLNAALNLEGIPLTLTDKPVVCKLCKYFAAIILKPQEDRPENSSNFFNEYKRRLLHFNDIVPMDEAAAEEPIIIPTKDKTEKLEQIKKKRKLNQNKLNGDGSDSQVDVEKSDQSRVPSSDSTNQSRPESPSDYMVDYNTLIPSIAMECGSDSETKSNKETLPPTKLKKIPRPETVKQAVEISKKLKNDKSSDIAVQRLGSNPSISVRQLFPCEEDLPLQGHIDFGNVKERTPEGWEKCTSIIQYDMDTKYLWQELQKPYGNQSSFLRHLVLLEKYFRNGDLVLSPNASHHSLIYSESVNNRLRSYDNIPANATNIQPLSLLSFNNKPQKSNSGIITSSNSVNKKEGQSNGNPPPTINAANIPKNTPITISQLNSPPLIPPVVVAKAKSVGAPPDLISIRPGSNKPLTSLTKVPQSQKIKFPITKNWRPNLIPIDPNKKNIERKAGLVQVISGGKPYHITFEDYKKMCAIKKSFELKQKRLQEASNGPRKVTTTSGSSSALKSMVPRRDLVISTTKTAGSKSEVVHEQSENILEKLDKQVEKLESRLNESHSSKPPLVLPKIPKSLTVIPQTVPRKPSRPSSPILLITQKPKSIINKS